MRTLSTVVLACITLPLVWSQQRAADELVAKALANSSDERSVYSAIAALNVPQGVVLDAGLFPAYRDLFEKITEKRQRQALAVALVKRGQRDDLYFSELAKYARIAIISNAPVPAELDDQGSEIKDRLNPAFLKWCEASKLERDACLEVVYSYAFDVSQLAAANDSRAIPLLRQGLKSPNYAIAAMSVLGLARLNDTDSLPLISASIQRFPPLIVQSIAARIVDFDDPRIGQMLNRFVADKKLRQELEERVRQRKAR